MQGKKPVVLVVLDGFGCSKEHFGNAIAAARTPHLDYWKLNFPYQELIASGPAVGILPSMLSNSQVGHRAIGAGRVVESPLKRLHNAIQNGTFASNSTLVSCLQKLKLGGGRIHIMGLLSDAGVHSSWEVLCAFIRAAASADIQKIYIHPFLDGRDSPPQSADLYLSRLADFLVQFPQSAIGSLHGRWYALDRDGNWDRTQQSYAVLTGQNAVRASSWQQVLQRSYDQGIFDEFVKPIGIIDDAIIQPGDGVIVFNSRADRARQITALLLETQLSCCITPISYGNDLATDVMLPEIMVKNTLKEVLAHHNQMMFTIAETEKFAHVTYFFDGGRYMEYATELRVMVPSLDVKDYSTHPAMSAVAITDQVIHSLNTQTRDFYLINYANADMVGHSGNFEATVKAIEILDHELGRLYDVVKQREGVLIITADHGKAEEMIELESGKPRTAHTNNSVPFFCINSNDGDGKQLIKRLPTTLTEVAPFIVALVGLPIPDEMGAAVKK